MAHRERRADTKEFHGAGLSRLANPMQLIAYIYKINHFKEFHAKIQESRKRRSDDGNLTP